MTHELFVDPAIKSMGWAIFESRPDHPYDGPASVRLKTSGVVKLKKDLDNDSNLEWIIRVDDMVLAVCQKIKHYKIEKVYIEMPSVYTGGKGGAAANSGAIMKLAFCVASIRTAGTSQSIPVELLPVRTWKGTVPKHITRKRINHYWAVDKPDHNEMDAIGMGDYWYRKHLGLGNKIIK